MSTMTSTPQSTDRPGRAASSTTGGGDSVLRSDDSVLRSAVRAGLVTAWELAEGLVELRGTALLLHGRPIAYAVGAAGSGRGAAGAAPGSGAGAAGERALADHEPVCLRLLAETGLVAEVHGDGTGEVVWASAISGESLTTVRGTMADLAEICQRWGAALAALHRTDLPGPGLRHARSPERAPSGAAGPATVVPGATVPEAPRPWLLDPDRPPRTDCPPAAGGARAYVLRTLRGDRGLRDAAARLADRWTNENWIHGDLTAQTVLVRHAPELQVRFVDLRGAGRGDPGWDLAGALETVAELTSGPQAPWRSASGDCLADYLMRGYRRSGGTASVEGATRALRMVARAWSLAEAVDARSAHAASLHPAAGQAAAAARLTERLALARELAARSARRGPVAA